MSQNPRLIAVDEALNATAADHQARIIYAAETGSRAYGWATPTSDTDVGCIFVRKRQEYLRLKPGEDASHTRHEGGIDMTAWDVRKALNLLLGSNIEVLEWLHAQTVFRDAGIMHAVRDAAEECWTPDRVCTAHWRNAQKRWNDRLRGSHVQAATYLPVVRSLLAVLWVEQENELPPLRVEDLTGLFRNVSAAEEMKRLVERRKLGQVKQSEPCNETLNTWIEQQLNHCYMQASNDKWNSRREMEEKDLDEILISAIDGIVD